MTFFDPNSPNVNSGTIFTKIVQLSSSEIDSPTSAQLSAQDTLYQLEDEPYTLYISDGDELEAIAFQSDVDDSVDTLDSTLTATIASLQDLQAQIGAGTGVNLDTILPGPDGALLDPAKVDAGDDDTLEERLAALDVVRNTAVPNLQSSLTSVLNRLTSLENRVSELEGTSPPVVPPLIVTAPTIAFPGGSANAGEQGTVTDGTYSGTALSGSRTYQLQVNGANVGTRFTGATTPVLPAAGSGVVIEYAPYDSGAQEVANPSAPFTIADAAPPPVLPVVLASPSLAFTGGGAPDVNDTATITQGTYTGGSVTGRTGRVMVNGVQVATVADGSSGQTFTVPASAGSAGRQLQYIELAANTAGPAVSNPSVTYTVNAPGVPIETSPATFAPVNAIDTDTLVVTRGPLTFGGASISQADPLLSYTNRWTFDWTLTGAPSSATSANLSSVWGGSTGTYTVIFYSAAVAVVASKSVTLTNGSAAFTWTGAVTSDSANVRVQVATTQNITLNTNNVGHRPRFYDTPTYNGQAGAEYEATTVGTVSSSASALEPGHRYFQTLSAAFWSNYQTQRGAFNAFHSGSIANAEALVASIPTSGGTTLSAGVTHTQINSALSANSVVFLTAGTYNLTGMVNIPTGKWLVGVAGAQVTLNFSGSSVAHSVRTTGGSSKIVNITIQDGVTYGLWFGDSNNNFAYKVSVRRIGARTGSPGAYAILAGYPGSSNTLVSCEAENTSGGNDADGFRIGGSGHGWTQVIDCHGYENDDDNLDVWQSTYPNFIVGGTYQRAGRNQNAFAISGDGNGLKLGTGNIQHWLDGVASNDNERYGFNYNANTQPQRLRNCTATGNLSGTYAGAGTQPNPLYYEIVNDSDQITLIGDSTVLDASGWGGGFADTLTQFTVVNEADSGESCRSFYNCFWDAVLATDPGGYMLIQFGHNDNFGPSLDCLGMVKETTVPVFQSYLTLMVNEARAAGIYPVFVTPLDIADGAWDGTFISNYADGMIETGGTLSVPVVDLHYMSRAYNLSIGQAAANALYTDGIHLNSTGGDIFGEMVADELLVQVPQILA
jgi:lysophospholipase L1-like esterase